MSFPSKHSVTTVTSKPCYTEVVCDYCKTTQWQKNCVSVRTILKAVALQEFLTRSGSHCTNNMITQFCLNRALFICTKHVHPDFYELVQPLYKLCKLCDVKELLTDMIITDNLKQAHALENTLMLPRDFLVGFIPSEYVIFTCKKHMKENPRTADWRPAPPISSVSYVHTTPMDANYAKPSTPSSSRMIPSSHIGVPLVNGHRHLQQVVRQPVKLLTSDTVKEESIGETTSNSKSPYADILASRELALKRSEDLQKQLMQNIKENRTRLRLGDTLGAARRPGRPASALMEAKAQMKFMTKTAAPIALRTTGDVMEKEGFSKWWQRLKESREEVGLGSRQSVASASHGLGQGQKIIPSGQQNKKRSYEISKMKSAEKGSSGEVRKGTAVKRKNVDSDDSQKPKQEKVDGCRCSYCDTVVTSELSFQLFNVREAREHLWSLGSNRNLPQHTDPNRGYSFCLYHVPLRKRNIDQFTTNGLFKREWSSFSEILSRPTLESVHHDHSFAPVPPYMDPSPHIMPMDISSFIYKELRRDYEESLADIPPTIDPDEFCMRTGKLKTLEGTKSEERDVNVKEEKTVDNGYTVPQGEGQGVCSVKEVEPKVEYDNGQSIKQETEEEKIGGVSNAMENDQLDVSLLIGNVQRARSMNPLATVEVKDEPMW